MTVVLLHDLGDPEGGAAWRAAAPADWTVPDLPGHGISPAVRTGHHDPMSAVAIARWTIAGSSDAPSTLIGVGQNAHGALVHAASGGCDRVVIVDGLWRSWRTPAEEVDAFYAMIRAIAADSAATGPAPAPGLDPRAAYGYGVMSSPRFARAFWAAVTQPLLAIETPRSPTPPAERAERIGWFGGPTTLAELDTTEPAAVVENITAWR